MLAASLVPLGSPSPRSRSHKMKGIGAITVKKIIETWRERERGQEQIDVEKKLQGACPWRLPTEELT